MKGEIFRCKITCENEIEVLSTMVQLYTASVTVRRDKSPLRKKLASLLAYYMKYGYNKESKDLAANSMGVKTTNLNVMNHELTKLGYLIPSTKNFNNKYLHPELEKLSEYYKKGQSESYYLFQIINKTND